jgi:hypothetical protein
MLIHRTWMIAVLILVGSGCNATSKTTGVDPTCAREPDFTAKAPAQVSAAEVGTILQRNCTLGGCHLGTPGAGNLELGPSSWTGALIGVPSRENPSMKLVAPGDPGESWIVHKVFGALCGYACDPKLGCGAEMPFGASLDEADRSTIAAWIERGAQIE